MVNFIVIVSIKNIMDSLARTCYLLNLETKKRISLCHGQLLVLGRNVESQIEDLYVSKNQIECTADIEKCEVKLKPVGRAISGIDGYAVVKDKTYTVGHGHRIELRLGFHEFEINFQPSPDSDDEEIIAIAKKPKIEFPVFNFKKESSDGNLSHIKDVSGKWEHIDNKELLIFTPANSKSKSKIAAFDIDGTIIKTKSGARFPKNADDWEFYLHDIPQHLKKLHEEDFKIVFFTNQSGVGKDSSKIKDFKRKLENILKKLLLPVQIFIATGKTIYRKPAPGMWNTLIENKNDNLTVDLSNSFYVGDAAGRDKNWAPKKKKDHSCADRLFALNIGINFYTPEEYFLKAKKVSYIKPEFDPRNLPTLTYDDIKYNEHHIISMVGGPGSGKSYFCKKILCPQGYVHINRDTLGSWQKCVKSLEEAVQQKKNCVIDNTNPDKESRSRYLDVAKKYNVSCYCFIMDVSHDHSKHNNKFRELTDKSHVQVSEIIINSYKKNYEEPDISEGFKEIKKIPFVPHFENKEHEKLYKLFLLEK